MNKKVSEAQSRIIDIIEGIKKDYYGREWNKFYGDTVCRIFMDFISKEFNSQHRIVGPNAYISGFPTEFDILIVDAFAEPIGFTHSFRPQEVKCGIESKAHGIFGGRNDIENNVGKIKDSFLKVNKEHSHILFLYLTYEEVAYPKKESSINYLRETSRVLAPYEVFCLKDSRSDKIILGEWERMLRFLRKHLYEQNVA